MPATARYASSVSETPPSEGSRLCGVPATEAVSPSANRNLAIELGPLWRLYLNHKRPASPERRTLAPLLVHLTRALSPQARALLFAGFETDIGMNPDVVVALCQMEGEASARLAARSPVLGAEHLDQLILLDNPGLARGLWGRADLSPAQRHRLNLTLMAEALKPHGAGLVHLISHNMPHDVSDLIGTCLGLSAAEVNALILGPSPVPLALLVAACGLDRAIFSGLSHMLAASCGWGGAEIRLARPAAALAPIEALIRLCPPER